MAISNAKLANLRQLKLELLEQRYLLAAAISSGGFSSAQQSDALNDLTGLSGHLLSNWDTSSANLLISAQPDGKEPLYFSSVKKTGENQFAFAEASQPLDENDFAILRARPFDLMPSILEMSDLSVGEIISLNLFADTSYSAVLQDFSINVNGTISLTAKLQDYDFAYGYVSITGNDYLVSIDIPEERAYFETRLHLDSGTVFLVQFAPERPDVLGTYEEPLEMPEPVSELPTIELPASVLQNNEIALTSPSDLPLNHSDLKQPLAATNFESKGNTDGQPTVLRGGGAGGAGSGNTVIDVMVVYTPAADAWSSNINNTIATAMARSNTAATNSNLGITFNLVYSGMVEYTESGSSTDLGRLRNPSDGFMDEVHTLRNSHAADMVAILTFTNDTGGVGYLLNTRYGREDLAFSLTRVQQASSTDTFVHELGHNMGAMHSKFQNVQAGPTNWTDWPDNNWSAGWRFQGNDGNYYTSVMAYSGGQYYSDGINATRVSIFSDPNITFQGQPVGHAVDGDNARSLRDVREYVGHYRDADTLLYCAAQGSWSGLGITNVRLGSIDQNASLNSYYDFSFSSADIQVGVSQQLTVSFSPSSVQNQIRVWVDWNDDKDFFDTGELVYISSPANVSQFVIPITAPIGTQPGQKRMRIRLHQPTSGGNLSPCGNSTTGEVQDFTLNVMMPQSSVVGSSVVHAGWTGSMGGPVDNLKVLAKESNAPQALGIDNLISTVHGINGLKFDIQNLPLALSAADFIFQWSPTGDFSEASHPPLNWELAAGPSSISSTGSSPSQVLIQWPDGAIMNRWLRVTILGNSNTGLSEPEVYYVGHLLGETTGPTDGVFSVTFADLSAIRSAVGQEVDSSNILDIDKNGTVGFSDISLMRLNIGSQLPVITVAGSGSSSIPPNAGTTIRTVFRCSPFEEIAPHAVLVTGLNDVNGLSRDWKRHEDTTISQLLNGFSKKWSAITAPDLAARAFRSLPATVIKPENSSRTIGESLSNLNSRDLALKQLNEDEGLVWEA